MEGHDKDQMREWIQASARIGRLDEAGPAMPGWMTGDDQESFHTNGPGVNVKVDCEKVFAATVQHFLKNFYGGKVEPFIRTLRSGVPPGTGIWVGTNQLKIRGESCGFIELRFVGPGGPSGPAEEYWFTPQAAIKAINLLQGKSMAPAASGAPAPTPAPRRPFNPITD